MSSIIKKCPAGAVVIPGDSKKKIDSFCVDQTEVTIPAYRLWKPEAEFIFVTDPPTPTSLKPATRVSWSDARNYCKARGGDLPTGIQWERAAAGPQNKSYATKSGQLKPEEANFNSYDVVDVGSFPPNKYQVYDMTGNAAEWVLDATKGAPNNRDIRGGSFATGKGLETSSRVYSCSTNHGLHDVGFRCAYSVQTPTVQGRVLRR